MTKMLKIKDLDYRVWIYTLDEIDNPTKIHHFLTHWFLILHFLEKNFGVGCGILVGLFCGIACWFFGVLGFWKFGICGGCASTTPYSLFPIRLGGCRGGSRPPTAPSPAPDRRPPTADRRLLPRRSPPGRRPRAGEL